MGRYASSLFYALEVAVNFPGLWIIQRASLHCSWPKSFANINDRYPGKNKGKKLDQLADFSFKSFNPGTARDVSNLQRKDVSGTAQPFGLVWTTK